MAKIQAAVGTLWRVNHQTKAVGGVYNVYKGVDGFLQRVCRLQLDNAPAFCSKLVKLLSVGIDNWIRWQPPLHI